MYIFWDNSNIQYAGLNSVLPVKEPDVDRGRYRTYFKGLLNLVSRGRIIDKSILPEASLREMTLFGMRLKDLESKPH